MSDKSFGDHVNRNIVKNSLLSSAVTGLSLEDLTHKAVLLPATPNQGQVTRLDQPQGSQLRTLAHADQDKLSFPSGDAFSNISLSNTPSNTLPNKLDSENNENIKPPVSFTQSKASVKTDDDFDVNEYIARLQGTRYVSAPLHSHLKDDQKTRLETEENLEEINLNEPVNEPVQQSLTADIAQNFSQLPTVLPHVASAVFSSFTNMLMKSREQTPDDTKSGYQEVQFERPDAGVPLMGVEEAPKDFGLPPKEPPVTGTSNYRITSKKKYAPIPGLTGAAQNYHKPNIQFTPGQLPPMMTPEMGLVSNKETVRDDAFSSCVPPFVPETKNVEGNDGVANVDMHQCTMDTNVYNLGSGESHSAMLASNTVGDRNIESAFNIRDKTGAVQFPDKNQSISTVEESQPKFTPIDHKDITTPRLPIIPPPPMFSNHAKSSQSAVGKSVLPPSVARRIAANQPLIKRQPMPPSTFPKNIFIPTMPETLDPVHPGTSLPPSITPNLTEKPPAMQSQFNLPSVPMTSQTSSLPLCTSKIQSSTVGTPFFTPLPAESLQSSTVGGQFFTPEISQMSTLETPSIPSNEAFQAFSLPGSKVLPPTAATNPPFATPSSSFAGPLPPSVGTGPNACISTSVPASHIQLTPVYTEPYIAPPCVPMFPPTSQVTPLAFFNPSHPQQDTIDPVPPATSELAKPLVEPPKATSNLNFRMTKKRPQYYSGPIEGVGDISNNVKPVIAPVVPPVDASAYRGSLFTPHQLPQSLDHITPNEQATVPFDISKPVEPAPYASFQAKPPPFTPFDINSPQKNYAQQYNTAFDLSRQTTEELNPPVQEPIGFGIIGSLKSKLSSIDINKIQSTVTTFFDPAYNDAKGEPALETTQLQYGQYSQEQSSFEITVPSVEQNQLNQFGYPQGYSHDQNQYYQAQNAFNYAGQNASSYFTEPSYATDQALNTNTQENIPQNIENRILSNQNASQEKKESNLYDPVTTQEPKIESIENQKCIESTSYAPFVSPNVGSHGAIGDVAIKTSTEQGYKPINPVVKATSFFNRPLVGADQANVKTYDNFATGATKDVNTDATQSRIHYSAPLPPAMTFFDSPITVAQESKEKTVDLVDEMKNLAMAEEIAIASSPFQAIDLQLGVNSESKIIDSSAVLKAVGHKAITTIALDKNVQNYPLNKEIDLGVDKKGISLIESLSKDTTPVVAVSSVPLFGLSAIIADKTQETSSTEKDYQSVCLIEDAKEIKSLLENQPFSLFENIAGDNKLREEPGTSVVGLSIADVKNVLLIEPPHEDLGSILQRKASSSMLPAAEVKSQNLSEDRDSSWNLDAAMVTSKDNVNVFFDRKTSGFFDHLVPSENTDEGTVKNNTVATDHASDFNICETCREVNTPGKETDNVTSQLIHNINSSLQFSNPVEEVLRESNPMADRAFDDMQFSEIDRITKDTIETIQGQSSNEQTESVGASSDNSYAWNTEHLAYASLAAIGQDFATNTADTSSLNFKTDENTHIEPEYELKLDPNAIGFFGDGSNSLFFDNVPKNASDELKAEFKTHDDIVLPRQMSIPSAPPAEEDDLKSDETGLDVLSIEQDAKKDFPLEEEFIIEPSETDDDKIEFRERKRSSEDSVHDTFTGRIEKFQNKSGTEVFDIDDSNYQKPAEAVPQKPMVSYFDTGNYAAETHYRNSLTYHTLNAFHDQLSNVIRQELTNIPIDSYGEEMGFQEHFRLPPGFEDDLRRQYKEQQMKSGENIEPFIPDTNTQTSISTTITYHVSGAHGLYTTPGLKANNKTILEDDLRKQYMMEQQIESGENNELFIPDTTTQTSISTTISYQVSGAHGFYTTPILEADSKNINFGELNKNKILTMEQSATNITMKPNIDESVMKPADKEIFEAPTLAKAFDSTNLVIKDHTQILKTQVEPEGATKAVEPIQKNVLLPDPINFFSAKSEEPKVTTDTTDPAEGFSRLASYFSMPPAQPDHSKSFFELSQSQNHYRHNITNNLNTGPILDRNLSQGQVDSKTQAKIQNLMHDLTSSQNINIRDEAVTIVHYFSVEHDNIEPVASKLTPLNLKTNKNEVKNIQENNTSINFNADKVNIPSSIDCNPKTEDANKTENSIINTIRTCMYCSDINLLNIKEYKVRTAADSETQKGSEVTMTEKESNEQKQSVSIDFGNFRMDKEALDGVAVIEENRTSAEYLPVRHHWFYRVDVDDKSLWRGFSMTDSTALENAYLNRELNDDTLIPTDGGRFDVNIIGRLRLAVYWKEKPTNVRRCSWFYKGTTDARYVPYTEAVADKLEEEYRHGVTTGEWHRRLVLPNNELVVMHGPAVMVHFLHGGCSDSFSSPPLLLGKRVYRNPPKIRVAKDFRPNIDHLILVVHGAGEYKKEVMLEDSTSRPRVVRRGHEESEIEDPEPSSIDHLLLLCHGVGSACDMRFRSVEEVVEDFRATSLQLLQSHYRNSFDNGIVNRVEVLPISWHAQLHVGEGGVDKRLNKLTLESIPRLRAFTNHTVLDALFYTSPVYHQTIIDTVCFELNRICTLFKERNPTFKGGVSLGGHSLGSVILYDLLCHQEPEKPLHSKTSANKTYLPSTTQPLATYPQLQFSPSSLYALGSPIAIFECIRGVEALGKDFALPTCKNFFNIFHPYDPIAYRIEPLINPLLQDAKPFLIPHHKGRKRMHLELKDTMFRVGADLKQKLVESLRTTWNKWKATPPPDGQLEKVVEEEMEKEELCSEAKEEQINAELTTPEMLGKLNDGRRVDYVLQEAPLEMINEYLFAMSSHVGYWESEDTMLLMLREIYSSLGVQPDCTVPQQSMTVTRTKHEEAAIVIEKDHPSTSRGSV